MDQPPELEFHGNVPPTALDQYLRDWIVSAYANRTLPQETAFAETLDSAPLGAEARRDATTVPGHASLTRRIFGCQWRADWLRNQCCTNSLHGSCITQAGVTQLLG